MDWTARKFVVWMLALAIVIAGGFALFNFIIDPYNRYGNNWLGVYISAEREAKATEIRRYNHDALIVGNSRMGVIPPAKVSGFRCFNGAFAGANPEEIYWFLYHFAKKQKVVILGIDLGVQDPPPKGDIFAPPDLASIVHNLLNFQTVEYSFRTINEHFDGTPTAVGRDGMLDMKGWAESVDRDDPGHFHYLLEGMKKTWGQYVCPPPERLSYYRKIADCLRERGIACVVVIPPMHEELVRFIEPLPAMAQYACWKQEIRKIFPHLVDLSFSAYGAAGNYYRADPAHFKPDVGAQIVNTEIVPLAQQVLTNRSAGRAAKGN